MRVAWVKPPDIGRVGDGHNHYHGAVCIDRVAADDDDRPSPRLLAALGWVEAHTENVTANGFWKCQSLAAHESRRFRRLPNHSFRTLGIARSNCSDSWYRAPFARKPRRSLPRSTGAPSPRSPAPRIR